jgi:hypothetical protein
MESRPVYRHSRVAWHDINARLVEHPMFSRELDPPPSSASFAFSSVPSLVPLAPSTELRIHRGFPSCCMRVPMCARLYVPVCACVCARESKSHLILDMLFPSLIPDLPRNSVAWFSVSRSVLRVHVYVYVCVHVGAGVGVCLCLRSPSL